MTDTSKQNQDDQVTLLGAVAIGVGGMVGGGIFAVLGLAAVLAGGATPVAFAIAGLVALLTAYSYAKLSVAYPDNGGAVIFIDKAFGRGWLTGALNNLLWLGYVITVDHGGWRTFALKFGRYLKHLDDGERELFDDFCDG
jgi:amino acid transporter